MNIWNIRKTVKKGDYVYAVVPEHPFCTEHGYVLMHRVVMENHIGRLLNSNEIVHHKDRNKKNNSIDNLELLIASEHSRMHRLEQGKIYVTLRCPWCGKEFDIPKNRSFIIKHNKFNCNCCSTNCRGKFTRFIQCNGITEELQEKINNSFIKEYKKFL